MGRLEARELHNGGVGDGLIGGGDRINGAARLISHIARVYLWRVTTPSTITAILLAGPTASGKSALAIMLAEQLGGTIINADSMQVYRDLRIITARPSLAEEARVPHRLYGHVDAAENYSVGRWCVDAQVAIADALRDGRLPILVGGTGLYFKALTRGLAAVPPVPADIRATIRARLAAEGIAPLYAELQARDPAAAGRLMPGDRSRITRALEVVIATGRSLADWHSEGMPPVLDAARALKLFLDVPRAELCRRIDARFDAMLADGAHDEVRSLSQRELDPSLPAMKAHGVPWLIRHLRAEITLDEATEGGKRDTRRYTKRQATWFRNQLPDFVWVAPERASAHLQVHGLALASGRAGN
jgi:tRNA dimethylallyltransferase